MTIDDPKRTPLASDDLAQDAAGSPSSRVDADHRPDEGADDSDERGDQASVVDNALTNLPPG